MYLIKALLYRSTSKKQFPIKYNISYSIALMNSLGLFAGITISNDGSFRIVLNVFQSIKFVDDWMFKNACSGLFTVEVNEPF